MKSFTGSGQCDFQHIRFAVTKVCFPLLPVCHSLPQVCHSLTPVCYSLRSVCYSLTPVCYSLRSVCYSLTPVCYSLCSVCVSLTLRKRKSVRRKLIRLWSYCITTGKQVIRCVFGCKRSHRKYGRTEKYNKLLQRSNTLPVQCNKLGRMYRTIIPMNRNKKKCGGQEVATLIHNRLMDEGMHEVQFDASKLSSGVYFYRISASSNERNFVEVEKMVLMK